MSGYEGSPPHARGKVEAAQIGAQLLGITPARAGKSDLFVDEDLQI